MTDWIVLISSILVPLLLVIGVLVFLIYRSKSSQASQVGEGRTDEKLSIDLDSLEVPSRPPRGPKLRVLGVDSTLAVFVLAPRGNSAIFPSAEVLHQLVDRIVPGFSKILDNHQPVFRRWEPQMSFEGFTHAFSYNMALPGDKGKGSRWSSVCGKMTVPAGQLFVGLVCQCDYPNEFGQLVIEHEGKWADTIRVI